MLKMVPIVIGALLLALAEARECKPTSQTEKVHKCYKAHSREVSWTKALAECRRKYGDKDGDLATVRNEEQSDAFQHAIGNRRGGVWLGASCEDGCAPGANDEWYWITDKHTVENDKWESGQPDSKNTPGDRPSDCMKVERVMMAIDGKWEDRPYWETHHYACEYCVKGDLKKEDPKTCVTVPSPTAAPNHGQD